MGRRFLKALSILLCFVMLIGLVPSMHTHAEPAEETIIITIEGGTAAFKGKDAVFTGKAAEGDVLSITLTPKQGRTFKRWESLGGTVITDPDFSMVVGTAETFWPVFEDTGDYPFGEWELVKDGSCTEGRTYKAVNSAGDVKYKKEYVNSGMHDFQDAVYIDAKHHKRVCKICGYEELTEHSFGSETVTKEATHAETGEKTAVCFDCGAEIKTVIPKTEEHSYGPWTVITPSVGGEYGVRRHTCIYCDSYEDTWYLNVDYRSIFKDRYIEYTSDTGWRKHVERYYNYTREDGREVYIFALQYSTSNAYDNNQTWAYMYIDDHDPDTLEPVYLSKTTGSSSVQTFIWAQFCKVYDYDGYQYVIDHPSGLGAANGMIIGNSMDSYDSGLLWGGGRWMDEVNSRYLSADKDPYAEFFTTTGEFKKWELDGENAEHHSSATYGVYNGDEKVGEYGGFADCSSYRKLVVDTDSKVYDYITIDNNTGLTVSYTESTTYPITRQYFSSYKQIISDEEYAALDENVRSAYLSVGAVEQNIKSFSASRSGFSNLFGLDPDAVTDSYKAVRVLADIDSAVSVTAVNWNVYTNPSKCYRIPYSEGTSNSYAITFEWDASNAGSRLFDAWEKWNWEQQKWEVISTAKNLIINTYAAPLTEPTYIRSISHINEVKHHIKTIDGYFRIGDDGTEYTEADVPEGAEIYLYYYNIEDKTGSCWKDSGGGIIDYYRQTVTADETYTAVYTDMVYGVYVYADGAQNKVWAAGKEDEAGYYAEASGAKGTVVRFGTSEDAENGYTQFLGWYYKIWGKGKDPTYVLISTDLELSYTITGYPDGDIYAVWSDGTVSLEPPEPDLITVRITGGYTISSSKGGEMDPSDDASRSNAYSTQAVEDYTDLTIIDDPLETKHVSKWTASWIAAEEPQSEEIEVDFEYSTHFMVMDAGSYDDRLVTITGETVEPCAQDAHEWSEGRVEREAAPGVEGDMAYVCLTCGQEKHEAIPALPAPPEPDHVLGDVTGEGSVTADDLTALSRYVAQIERDWPEDKLKAADVDGNGDVDANDLTKLSRYVAMIITSLD